MSPETVAIAKCERVTCGKDVAVKLNRSGLAYYRCDHCGREMKEHWQRKSDAFIASIGAPVKDAPDADPAPAAQVKPPPAPKPVKAAPASPPPAPSKSTFF